MKDLKVGGNGTGINSEIVRTYPEPDWLLEKFPQRERSLRDWKDLVSEEGRIKIEKLIIEEIFKKLGS